MDLSRKPSRGSFSLLTLGLLFAAGVQGYAANAEGVDSDAASSSDARPGTPPSAGAKVHGTITVDFDKLTIAELLKLVRAVEKVDGVIHIVSSTAVDGEPAMVVHGGPGTLAVSGPASTNHPRLVIDTSQRVNAPPSQQVQRAAMSSRSGQPELPRLASLGRLLGLVKHAEDSAAERVDPATLRRTSSLAEEARPTRGAPEPRRFSMHSLSDTPVDLTAGGQLELLASGGPSLARAIPSPWPAPGTNAAEPSRDPEVSRADHAVQAEGISRPETYVAGEGETFEALARRFYGDARYAWALWWANRDRIAWPDALTPGKPITVPALGRLDPKMVMTESPAGGDATRDRRAATPRRDPDIVRASSHSVPIAAEAEASSGGFAVHVVRPEDTLRIIAREKCGDERKALEIIALNRDVLTPEGRPRVGQRLILPAAVLAAP